MTTRFRLVAVVAAGGLLLTGCGGDKSATSSSTANAATSSTMTSSTDTTSASGGLTGNLQACMDAATAGLDLAGVSLDSLTGKFDQAAFDKAFPAGTVDKLPAELKDAYTATMNAAKELIGKSGTSAADLSQKYTEVMTTYSNELAKVCSG